MTCSIYLHVHLGLHAVVVCFPFVNSRGWGEGGGGSGGKKICKFMLQMLIIITDAGAGPRDVIKLSLSLRNTCLSY